MTTIYQWSLVIYSTRGVRITHKTKEVKETAKQYRALEGYFLNYTKVISKDALDTVVSNVFPTYSSLEPNEEIAVAKLAEWYENFVKDKVASLEAEISDYQTNLKQVLALANNK